MKSFDTEIKKYAEKVHLRATERRELRDRVLSYMEYHPLSKKREALVGVLESQRYISFHFNTLYTKLAAGVFLLLFIVGLPIAAERAVPGDALYLIKTGINEGIQAQFANSPYEKVEFETMLMERRIAEARLLASEGKLTEEVEAKIARTVKDHADAAQSGLAELRANNADEAAIAEIAYGSALEVQSAVLDSNSDSANASSTDTIRNAVRTAQEEADEKRGSSIPSFTGLMARIEFETTRAYELYEAIQESATDEERTDIERRLSDIDRKIADALDLVEENDEESAIPELINALSLVQKLIVFMTDIDVRENVSLDTLVPIELSIDERMSIINEQINEVNGIYAVVLAREPYIEDEGLREKVVLGMSDLGEYIHTATSSLDVGDIDAAEQALTNSYALAHDLDQLTFGIEMDETLSEDVESTEEETATTTDEATTEDAQEEPAEPVDEEPILEDGLVEPQAG